MLISEIWGTGSLKFLDYAHHLLSAEQAFFLSHITDLAIQQILFPQYESICPQQVLNQEPSPTLYHLNKVPLAVYDVSFS